MPPLSGVVQLGIAARDVLAQPFHVAEQFTGNKGVYCKLEDTIKDAEDILAGKYDAKPESWFYMAPGPLSEKKD